MPIVDMHAHVYPEKIAERAVAAVGNFYGIPMSAENVGTADHLVSLTHSTAITHFAVLAVATSAKNVSSINSFIAEQCAKHPNLIGFASMHPDFEDIEAEVDRIAEAGLHGVKLHPDTQQVDIDDPRLMPLYDALERKGLRAVIHTGDYRYEYSNAKRLLSVAKRFPTLTINAAHYGSWSKFDTGFDVLWQQENVFADSSSSSFMLGARHMTELTRLWGTDRIMFGSDYPMWKPIDELRFMESLDFTDDEKENLFWHNAERFLGTTIE